LQQLPAEFLAALSGHDEVLVTSREGAGRGTVPMWFITAPPGVVYLFTFAFSEKARRWRSDPWVRLTVPDHSSTFVEGVAHVVAPEEVDDELGERVVERWSMQGAPTIEGLRRTLRDRVHALIRVEAA
jgi:general stress protein 26